MKIEEPIKTTVEEIRKLMDIENFIGEPIELEDKLLVPVMKMGVGFGAGMGKGESVEEGELMGSGSGAAAGGEPVALVVIFKGVSGPEGVKVLDLSSTGVLSKAIDELSVHLPEIIKEIKPKRKQKKESASKKDENEE